MDAMGLEILSALLLLGLILVLIEFFLVPGTTVVGIVGGFLMIAAVVLTFLSHGNKVGSIFLLLAFFSSAIALYFGFKVYSSDKLSVNSKIDSRNYLQKSDLEIGMTGLTVSALRPGGKVKFGHEKLEVYAQDEFIDSGVEVEVVGVQDHKIYVKSKNA